MLDIREIPTIYINMDKDTTRRHHMENTLSKNGFKNYRRQAAYTTNDADIYHAAFTTHMRACYSLSKESSPYVLVLEDDVTFTDIPALNAAINSAIKNDDFELFSITHATEEPHCYTPPKKGNYLAHFVLYKRDRIPSILVKLYNTWLVTEKTDIWELYGVGAYMYTGSECIQLSFYFQTVNTKGNSVLNFMALCLFTEDDISKKHLPELVEKYTNKRITVQQLTRMRNLLVRVYRYHKGDSYLSSLDTMGNVRFIYLPITLYEKYTDMANRREVCKYALVSEGIDTDRIYGYDMNSNRIYLLE